MLVPLSLLLITAVYAAGAVLVAAATAGADDAPDAVPGGAVAVRVAVTIVDALAFYVVAFDAEANVAFAVGNVVFVQCC